MVYAADSKSAARKGLRVQVSSPAPRESLTNPATRACASRYVRRGEGTIWVLPTSLREGALDTRRLAREARRNIQTGPVVTPGRFGLAIARWSSMKRIEREST